MYKYVHIIYTHYNILYIYTCTPLPLNTGSKGSLSRPSSYALSLDKFGHSPHTKDPRWSAWPKALRNLEEDKDSNQLVANHIKKALNVHAFLEQNSSQFLAKIETIKASHILALSVAIVMHYHHRSAGAIRSTCRMRRRPPTLHLIVQKEASQHALHQHPGKLQNRSSLWNNSKLMPIQTLQ